LKNQSGYGLGKVVKFVCKPKIWLNCQRWF